MGNISTLEIYKLTPKTNCKQCGKETCMAFAMALGKGELQPEDCPPLGDPKFSAQLNQLKVLVGPIKKSGGELPRLTRKNATVVGHVSLYARWRPGQFTTLSGKAPKFPPDEHVVYRVIDGKCHVLQLDHCRRFESTGEEA